MLSESPSCQLVYVPEASSSAVGYGQARPNHVQENVEIDDYSKYRHELLTAIDRLLEDVDLCSGCKEKLLSRLHGNFSNSVAM